MQLRRCDLRLASAARPVQAQALLMALAERADVIVDFRGLADGTVVNHDQHRVRTSPSVAASRGRTSIADPATTGQVMRFVVKTSLLGRQPHGSGRRDTGH